MTIPGTECPVLIWNATEPSINSESKSSKWFRNINHLYINVSKSRPDDSVEINKIYYLAQMLFVLIKTTQGNSEEVGSYLHEEIFSYYFPESLSGTDPFTTPPEIKATYLFNMGEPIWSKDHQIYGIEQELFDQLMNSKDPIKILNSWNREKQPAQRILDRMETSVASYDPDMQKLWPLPDCSLM